MGELFLQIVPHGLAAVVACMSLIGFALMGIDKYKAQHDRWRIPERTLMLIALLGGSPGVWLGMRVFHHKTLHRLFSWGVPAIFAAEAALAVYFGLIR